MELPHTSSPRSGTSPDSFHGCLAPFIEHLKQEGLTEGRIRCLRASARHFLVWLGQEDIDIGVIDDAVLRRFRRHDCRCPSMERERRKMLAGRSRQFVSGALRLVRFFEQSGRLQHPGELDEGLRLLEEFLAECAGSGYAPDSLMGYRSACRHVLVWLHQSRVPMRRMDADVLERFVAHDCVCPGPFESPRKRLGGGRYVYPVELFSRFLAARGVLPGAASTTRNEVVDADLEAFGEWLRRHRGAGEATIVNHLRRVAVMRTELGADPGRYNAASVREVLLRRFATASRPYARALATSMRMYLRFLAARGECRPALVGAVPTAPGWRLCELPRYVPAVDIERVIASCNVTTPVGLRDRAILLLLARLALRAGDVVHLRLSDLDWENARVRVCGKSRREAGLPLPQDAGDAVLDYIEHARPRIGDDRLFLTVRAPYRPFTSSNAITDIVIQALKRAGMDDVKPKGAYLFRHSAATNLLRAGASLDVIGALLRHRSPDTTVIYAKTDRPMLLEVAQPWIGDVR